jgi:hypothetical protein
MNEPMMEAEAFEYAYKNFIALVEILALDSPAEQCKAQGNYNTAYELWYFVTGGKYMFDLPNQPLTPEQKQAILAFVAKMETVPKSVFGHGYLSAGNLAAMSDPWWLPVSTQAKKLLTLLGPATKKNREYFVSLGPPIAR